MNLDRLEELAKKAKPGPWTTEQGDRDLDKARYPTDEKVLVMANNYCESHPIADCSANHSCQEEFEQADNAAYIAAMSPDIALKLIKVVRAAEILCDADAHDMCGAIHFLDLREALKELES